MMTPNQEFFVELAKMIVPPVMSLIVGIHLRQPSYMKKSTPDDKFAAAIANSKPNSDDSK